MISNKEYIYYGDKLLVVKRKLPEQKLNPDFDPAIMKEWTMSEILLKKEGVLYCCEEVPEAEVINEE